MTSTVELDVRHSLPALERPAPEAPRPPVGPTVRRLVGEQAVVLAGQALAGAGNLAFLLAAVRLLPGAEFAELATFQALYLLVLMPTLGLSAGGSSAPDAVSTSQRRTLYIGGALAVALAGASVPLGGVLQLPWALVVLLGLTLPAAGPLALARGRLYGRSRPLGVTASLVAEPVVRLSAGIPLMKAAGPIGGGVGVVLGSYAALAIARLAGRRRAARHTVDTAINTAMPATTARRGLPLLTVAGFTLLAVVQNQDLVLANGLLSGSAAGEFAALSAIGGIAAFATSTVPMVLLPRLGAATETARRALRVAIFLAGGLGLVAVGLAAGAPTSWYADVVGTRHADVSRLALPYLVAMALLGVARVLAARVLAVGRRRSAVAVCGLAAAVQATTICLAPRTPRAVSLSTLLATAVLAAGLGGLASVRLDWRSRLRARLSSRDAVVTASVLTGVTVVAVVLRLLITRGLWLDEATSVTQAKMSFAGMLHNLRTTDVHPPGYFTILWGWIRVFGSGPLSVRMPSILIGVVTVPVVFFAARDIYGRRTAWVAAIFATVAPQMVWYSQEARMYSLFMLLVVLAVWAQVRALRSGSWRAWIALGVVSAAMMWTQYFTVLVVIAQQLVIVAVVAGRVRRREPARRLLLQWLAALAVFAVLIAPLVPFAHQQFAVNQSAGRGFNTPSAAGGAAATQTFGGLSAYVLIANLLWAVWGYQPTPVMTALGALWPIGMLLVLVLLGRGRSRTTTALLAVALLPVAVVFAIGTQKRFLFDLRYFIGVVPLLAILAARAAATWPKRTAGVVALTGVMTASLAVGLGDQQLNGNNPRRYDFAPALQQIAANAGPRDQVILAPPFLNDLSNYYEPQLVDVPDRGSSEAVVARTATDPRVFLLGSFFENGGTSHQIAELLAELSSRRTLVQRWRLSNVRVWEFQ
jgi:uncharacterized membrane protein